MIDRARTIVAAGLIGLLAGGARGDDDFPAPGNSEKTPGEPMAAEEAARSFGLPEGFHVSLFAAEPDVRNPIACAWDEKGRLWVAENYTYAEREQRFDLSLRDRVLILEDRDGDGKMDSRNVFSDDVQMLTSVEVGRGGVWMLCPPQLLFVRDQNGDDRPDGPAEVVLDGFDVPAENYHNFANGLRWGPDGWLYGRCGASSPGKLGAPGTAEDRRVPMNGGMWRYHPERKVVEALTAGTTNPWGHDWDALGELFFINTVNGHLWHAVAGAHFVRPHTIDPNPYVYKLIDQHADHWHWDTAKDWSDSRNPTAEHDAKGGGHAHSGVCIYLGDNWPEEYRGKLMTLNFHGRRVNVDRLDREGSGFVGRHEPDILRSGDPFFRGIDLTYGPDGGVYILDWSDTGECHENTGVHRLSGRIFKVTYGKPGRGKAFDLGKESAKELAERVGQPGEWHARQARRLLADRAAMGEPVEQAVEVLESMASTSDDPVVRVRAIGGLMAMGKADERIVRPLLKHQHEAVRAWAVRALTDGLPLDTVSSRRPGVEGDLTTDLMGELAGMAKGEPSGLVRLVMASTLQRLPVGQRAVLAAGLLAHGEDSGDHNLPRMIWYGLIPLGERDPMALAGLAEGAEIRETRELIARRLAERLADDPAPLDRLIGRAAKADQAFREDLIAGMTEGLKGRRKERKPGSWDELAKAVVNSGNARMSERTRELSVVFGDGRALEEVRALAMDGKAPMESRRAALESLIEARPGDLKEVCEKLLGTRFLNKTAAAGLALFDDPEIGNRLVASYRTFHPTERGAVVDTLCSRPTFARALMDAVAGGAIPRGDVTAFHARRIRSLGDEEISGRLAEVWGELRDSPTDRKALIEEWRGKLSHSEAADPGRGRAVFNEVCANCHRLYGQGGEIGPDLTGAGRDNVDYLLENVLDPSAVVTADFRMTVMAMKDGRVLNGIVVRKDDRTVTLQTDKERVVLPRDEVEEERASTESLMPDGLLKTLDEGKARDLFAYLRQRTQVALPGEEGGR